MQKKTHNRYINKIYKMNTQRKIFEVLAKKQDLGAIEDAINDVKNTLAEAESNLERIIINFNSDLDNSTGVINNEIETIKNYSSDYDESFAELLRMHSDSLDELKTAGIDYDESTLDQLKADFERTMNTTGNIYASEIR